ncbi:hypothetical protein MferCBS31731_003033 [Microsporum ferrugineum]
MSRVEFTDEEKTSLKAARKALKEARAGRSEEVYGSDRYWDFAQLQLDQEEAIAKTTWHARERSATDPSDPEFQAAKSVYLYQQDRRALRRRSLREKQEIFQKRNTILELSSKPSSITTICAAYVELLMDVKTRTSRQDQPSFSPQIKKAYGGTAGTRRDPMNWCVLDGKMYHASMFRAAHIFPLSLGQSSMAYVFGPDAKGEINCPRNGLLLPTELERTFDDHRVVIVPAESHPDGPREWKFLVLDRSGLWNSTVHGPHKYSDIHQQRLIFPNNVRPRARYLYFHYLCSMIYLFRQDKRTGVVRSDLPDSEIPELTRAWGSHGSYLRDCLISGFIDELGHELPEGLKEDMRSNSFSSQSENELEEVVNSLDDLDLDSDDESDEEEYLPFEASSDSEAEDEGVE